jgi:uncharacterized SAM-binding protein YcdF (DUF218 family)
VIRRRGRLIRGALAASVVVVVALAGAAPHAGTALIVRSPVLSPDAIVSLASHEWERLPEAVFQARAFPKALVVLTVPKVVTQYNCHDCERRHEQLVSRGVDPRRIHHVPITASGTYGEAVSMKRFMQEHHLEQLLVVTSPYHARRSLATFRSVFAGTPVSIGVAPASRTSPARPDAWWWAAYDRAYVRYEWTAIVYYWVWHGVPLREPSPKSRNEVAVM